jgi:hypothetical protein
LNKLKPALPRKFISKEGICTQTGDDSWMLEELNIIELEIQSIMIGDYRYKGKCKTCGKTTDIDENQYCMGCNPFEQHQVYKDGEI